MTSETIDALYYADVKHPRSAAPGRAKKWIGSLFNLWTGYAQKRAERRQRYLLTDLSDHLLRDIGLTEGEIFDLRFGAAGPVPGAMYERGLRARNGR